MTVPADYEQFVPRQSTELEDTDAQDIEPFEFWFARKGTDRTDWEEYSYVTIKMVRLVFSKEPDFAAMDEASDLMVVLPEGMTERQIHDATCDSYKNLWSFYPDARDRIFDVFDDEKGIGRCVNAASYQTIFLRQVDAALIIVETANPDEFTAVRSKLEQMKGSFAKLPTAEKWHLVRQATNAEVAEQILLSAQLSP